MHIIIFKVLKYYSECVHFLNNILKGNWVLKWVMDVTNSFQKFYNNIKNEPENDWCNISRLNYQYNFMHDCYEDVLIEKYVEFENTPSDEEEEDGNDENENDDGKDDNDDNYDNYEYEDESQYDDEKNGDEREGGEDDNVIENENNQNIDDDDDDDSTVDMYDDNDDTDDTDNEMEEEDENKENENKDENVENSIIAIPSLTEKTQNLIKRTLLYSDLQIHNLLTIKYNGIYFVKMINPEDNMLQKVNCFPNTFQPSKVTFLAVEYTSSCTSTPVSLFISKMKFAVGSEILNYIFVQRQLAYNYGNQIKFDMDYKLKIIDSNFNFLHLNKHKHILINENGYEVKNH